MSIECPANVVTDTVVDPGAALCLDSSSAPVAWVAVPAFDVSQLDTVSAASAFAAGFVIVGTCWCIGKAVGMILSVIRR